MRTEAHSRTEAVEIWLHRNLGLNVQMTEPVAVRGTELQRGGRSVAKEPAPAERDRAVVPAEQTVAPPCQTGCECQDQLGGLSPDREAIHVHTSQGNTTTPKLRIRADG